MVDEEEKPTLAQSQVWADIQKGGRLSYYKDRPFQAAEYLIACSGNGRDWVNGFLRTGARKEDNPFRSIAEDDTTEHPLIARIPACPGFAAAASHEDARVYPISQYSPISVVPDMVDPWWLALCVLFANETKDRDHLWMRRDKDGLVHNERSQIMMRQVLVMLMEIVEDNFGGWDDFAPHVQAWVDALGDGSTADGFNLYNGLTKGIIPA
ncbi:MAG: hypothetical protein EOP83_21345 [Verrucomicrobiaceae bacterium]|nr:MAG: hypothetical protein EOP83_21345 [Verrucomicrobiaceae bacterium]